MCDSCSPSQSCLQSKVEWQTLQSCIRNNAYNNEFPIDCGGASVGFQAVHSTILTYVNLCSVLLFRSGRHKALVTKANHMNSMTKRDFLGRVLPSANCFVALPLLRPKRGGRGPWVTGQGLYMRHYVILRWPWFTLLPRCLSAHLCNSRDYSVRLDACALSTTPCS